MIRQYKERDLEDLLCVWEIASAIAHPFLTPEFIASERDNIPNLYLPNTETWVYEENEQVVGFISLMGNEVGAIFIHPDCQRKGIGRRLMDKAKTLRGNLDVEVFTANKIGRNFYNKYGFECIEEKIHEQTGFAIMRLQLLT